MKSKQILKLVALSGMMLALFALLASVAKPGVVSATANPLPPLLSCPNLDGSTEVPTMPPDPTKLGQVRSTDMLVEQQHYGNSFGQPGYGYLYDPVSPYNSTNPAYPSGTGRIGAVDMLFVQQRFGLFCPIVDTQIAEATRALTEPMYSNILCDPTFAMRVPCGGDPQFLTVDPANPAFLTSKGYRQGSTDVPGQGIHYVNMSLWDGVFNPARPEGLVYKNMLVEDPGPYSGSCTDGVDNSAAGPSPDGLIDGADPDCQVYRLVAQLYYAEGDAINWSPSRDSNVRAVNTDSFCTPVAGEPPGTGCSWNGTHDGFHWHANLCTWAIGTVNAFAFPLPPGSTQSTCASYAAGAGHPCTAFYPAAGWTCTFKSAVGYMGHLWNWLPNANYTSGQDPGPSGLGDCQAAYCNTLENNGRFADCFPDPVGGPWHAYDCPQ